MAFLKKYGLDVALDNVGLMEQFGLDQVNLAVDDQDSVYLTEAELKAEGYHGMASVNVNGLYSYKVRPKRMSSALMILILLAKTNFYCESFLSVGLKYLIDI